MITTPLCRSPEMIAEGTVSKAKIGQMVSSIKAKIPFPTVSPSKGRSFILPSPFPAEKAPVFLSLIGLFAGHDAGHWAQALPVSPAVFPRIPSFFFLALLFQ